MIPSKDQFAELLRLLGLPEAQAEIRARWLIEDLEWIGFDDFSIFCDPYYRWPEDTTPLPIVEYSFGNTVFDVNNAASSRDLNATSIGGSTLSRGPLLMLSQVSEIARRLIPHLWLKSEELRKYLRTPAWHIAKLDEIWWLGRFTIAADITDRFSHREGTDIDWRFRLNNSGYIQNNDLWINLEVKNRPSDASRMAHREPFKVSKILREVRKKFNPSSPEEVNVVAVTLFGPIDRTVQLDVSDWLQSSATKQPVVDAVLLWSLEGRVGSYFDIQLLAPKASILKAVVLPPDANERAVVRRLLHTIPRNRWPRDWEDSLPPDL